MSTDSKQDPVALARRVLNDKYPPLVETAHTLARAVLDLAEKLSRARRGQDGAERKNYEMYNYYEKDLKAARAEVERLDCQLRRSEENLHSARLVAKEERAKNKRLRGALAFFASVIKSGEPWTDTCEREYRAALGEEG